MTATWAKAASLLSRLETCYILGNALLTAKMTSVESDWYLTWLGIGGQV